MCKKWDHVFLSSFMLKRALASARSPNRNFISQVSRSSGPKRHLSSSPPPSYTSSMPAVREISHKPVEIRVKKAERCLYITWDDGTQVRYSAEFLRVESPSAEVQGHGGHGQKRLITGRKFVNIIGVVPQGNYAVLIQFDDLHDTGIYSWQYLHWLGQNKVALMRSYIKQLKATGKSRDPRRPAPASRHAPQTKPVTTSRLEPRMAASAQQVPPPNV